MRKLVIVLWQPKINIHSLFPLVARERCKFSLYKPKQNIH